MKHGGGASQGRLARVDGSWETEFVCLVPRAGRRPERPMWRPRGLLKLAGGSLSTLSAQLAPWQGGGLTLLGGLLRLGCAAIRDVSHPMFGINTRHSCDGRLDACPTPTFSRARRREGLVRSGHLLVPALIRTSAPSDKDVMRNNFLFSGHDIIRDRSYGATSAALVAFEPSLPLAQGPTSMVGR